MVMLFALVGAMPLLAGAAGLAGLLLQRADFGILVWGLVPLLGLLAVAAVLGVILGKAAGGRRDRRDKREESRKPQE